MSTLRRDEGRRRRLCALQGLIEAGADVNAVVDGETALTVALDARSYNPCIDVLVEGGADVTVQRKLILARAVRNFNSIFLRRLELTEGDLNAVDEYGRTLLILCAQAINFAHADADAAEEPAWAVALRRKPMDELEVAQLQVMQMLIKAGANLNDTDTEGRSALWYAARLCRKSAINLLLEHGARVDVTATNGVSVLDRARLRMDPGREDIVELLREKNDREGRLRFWPQVCRGLSGRSGGEDLSRLHFPLSS